MLIKTEHTISTNADYADEVNQDIERFLNFSQEHQDVILKRAEELFLLTKNWSMDVGLWEEIDGLKMNEQLDRQMSNLLTKAFGITTPNGDRVISALTNCQIDMIRMLDPTIYLPLVARCRANLSAHVGNSHVPHDICLVLKGYKQEDTDFNYGICQHDFHVNDIQSTQNGVKQRWQSLLVNGEIIPPRKSVGGIYKDSSPFQTTSGLDISKRDKVQASYRPVITGLAYGTNNDIVRLFQNYRKNDILKDPYYTSTCNIRPATISEIVAMLVARNDFPPPVIRRINTISILPSATQVYSPITNQQNSNVDYQAPDLNTTTSPQIRNPTLPERLGKIPSPIPNNAIARSIPPIANPTLRIGAGTNQDKYNVNNLPILTKEIIKSFEDGELNLEKTFGIERDFYLLALLKPYGVLYHSTRKEFISKGYIDIDFLLDRLEKFYNLCMPGNSEKVIRGLLVNSTNIFDSGFIQILMSGVSHNTHNTLHFLHKIYPIDVIFNNLIIKDSKLTPQKERGMRSYLESLKIFSSNEIKTLIGSIKFERVPLLIKEQLPNYNGDIKHCDKFKGVYASYYDKRFEELLEDNNLFSESDSSRLYIAYNKFLSIKNYEYPDIIDNQEIADFLPIMLVMLEDPTLDFQTIYESNYL